MFSQEFPVDKADWCRASPIRDAINIVTDPDICRNRPFLRYHAWLALKSARGQSVDQIKLGHDMRQMAKGDLK